MIYIPSGSYNIGLNLAFVWLYICNNLFISKPVPYWRRDDLCYTNQHLRINLKDPIHFVLLRVRLQSNCPIIYLYILEFGSFFIQGNCYTAAVVRNYKVDDIVTAQQKKKKVP